MTASKHNTMLLTFLCRNCGNLNSFLITSLPKYLLKELSAVAVLFNLHERECGAQGTLLTAATQL